MTRTSSLFSKLTPGGHRRQNRPDDHDLIRAYGVKADISNGVPNATFDMFPIGPTAFPPLFPGTTTDPCNSWAYDHVFAQKGVCLNENARIAQCPPPWDCSHPTGNIYQHFMADDYTWAAADGSYFYFAWCDRSRRFGSGAHVRAEGNVRLARIIY